MSIVVLKVALDHLNLVNSKGFGLKAVLHLSFRPVWPVKGIRKQRLIQLLTNSDFHLSFKLGDYLPRRLKYPSFGLNMFDEQGAIEIHSIYSKLLQQDSLDIIVLMTM